MPTEPLGTDEPTPMERYLVTSRLRDVAARLTAEYAFRDRLGDRDALPALLLMRRRVLEVDPSNFEAQRALTRDIAAEWLRLRSERGF